MNCFIDFEATQFSNEIISIGCIDDKGNKFYSLVKPKKKVTQFITDLTGITQGMVEDAEDPETVFSKFYDWCIAEAEDEKIRFYCYGNADVKFLKNHLRSTKSFKAGAILSYVIMNLIDYAPIVKNHYGLCKMINLGKIANHIRGYEVIQNHDALDDAVLLKYVFDNVEATPADLTCVDLMEYREVQLPIVDQEIKEKCQCGIIVSRDKRCKLIVRKFDEMSEAINYVLEEEVGRHNNRVIVTQDTPRRIENKIKNAFKQKKQYCGKYWTII